MLQKILGDDPKTTLGGLLLAVGLAATRATDFGLPRAVAFAGVLLAAAGAVFLGRNATDAGRAYRVRMNVGDVDPDKVAEALKESLERSKGGAQ